MKQKNSLALQDIINHDYKNHLKQKRKELFKESLESYRDAADNFNSQDLEKLYRKVEFKIEDISQLLYVAVKAVPELDKISRKIAESDSSEVDKILSDLHYKKNHQGVAEEVYLVIRSFFYRNLEKSLDSDFEELKVVMNAAILAYAKNPAFIQPQKKHLQTYMWERIEPRPEFAFIPNLTKSVYEKFFQPQFASKQNDERKQNLQKLVNQEAYFARHQATYETCAEIIAKYQVKEEYHDKFLEAIRASFLTGSVISFERVLMESLADELPRIFANQSLTQSPETIIEQLNKDVSESMAVHSSKYSQSLALLNNLNYDKQRREIIDLIKFLPKEITESESNFFRLYFAYILPGNNPESFVMDGKKFFTAEEKELVKKMTVALQLFPRIEESEEEFNANDVKFCYSYFLQEVVKNPENFDNILTQQDWSNLYKTFQKLGSLKKVIEVGEFDDVYQSVVNLRNYCDGVVQSYYKNADNISEILISAIEPAEEVRVLNQIIKPKIIYQSSTDSESASISSSSKESDREFSTVPKSSFRPSNKSAFVEKVSKDQINR